MDYFEITAVIDENKVKAKGNTVDAIMIAIDRVAADVGIPKIESGEPNVAKYRIDMDISTSFSSAGMLSTTLYKPWIRQYLSALTWYDSFEDNIEDVFAEIDDLHKKDGGQS